MYFVNAFCRLYKNNLSVIQFQVIVGTGEQVGEHAFMEAELVQEVEYIGVASDSAAASNGVWVFNMGELI